MSTQASPPTLPARTLRVVSHTKLIYLWPVWPLGFILAGLCHWQGDRLAVVPPGTSVTEVQAGKIYELTLASPATHSLAAAAKAPKGQEAFPVRIAEESNYGILYIVVVVLVIFGSNVPFRGLASIIAILFVFLVTLLFAYFHWWTHILDYVGGLHVEISVAGYLIPSIVLLILWLATIFLYDPMRYMVFTPGQIVLHKEIGDLREVFDTAQVEAEKKRSDLFRH